MHIQEFLKRYKDRHIYYMSNPGNGGDALIAFATYCLFKKLGLQYTTIDRNTSIDLTSKTVFYSGGGNFVKEYTFCSSFIEKNLNKFKELIVLPHTINSHYDLITKFGKNVTLICREETSYQYVKQVNQICSCLLIEDLAFTLPINDLKKRLKKNILPIFLRLHILKMFRYQHQVFYPILNILFGRTLHAFRIDKESTDINKPKNNLDLSLLILYDSLMSNEILVERNTVDILSVINKYRTVHTNRLHIAIAAALLGKDVLFHPNSYYKNESVYTFSLKQRYPNVRWTKEQP